MVPARSPTGQGSIEVPMMCGETLRNHTWVRDGTNCRIHRIPGPYSSLPCLADPCGAQNVWEKHKCHWDQCRYGGVLNPQKGS
jgi:hypothetical protein